MNKFKVGDWVKCIIRNKYIYNAKVKEVVLSGGYYLEFAKMYKNNGIVKKVPYNFTWHFYNGKDDLDFTCYLLSNSKYYELLYNKEKLK